MRRRLAILACAGALSGCASTTYTLRPYYDAGTGTDQCCEVTVVSSRNVQSVVLHAIKTGNDWTVDLTEQGVSASEPDNVQAGAVGNILGNTISGAVQILK